MPQTLVKSLREEKRREEKISAQLLLCSCFYKIVGIYNMEGINQC